jgi:hypothetical protein
VTVRSEYEDRVVLDGVDEQAEELLRGMRGWRVIAHGFVR